MSWNHGEFAVAYTCLAQHSCVAGVYVQLLLDGADTGEGGAGRMRARACVRVCVRMYALGCWLYTPLCRGAAPPPSLQSATTGWPLKAWAALLPPVK